MHHNQRTDISGLTLIEMLVVCIILSILVVLGVSIYRRAQASALEVTCGSHLKQTYMALRLYRERSQHFPILAPPDGLSDRVNWGDLFAATDPGMGYFLPGSGDKTRDPRVPRLLEGWVDDIEILICPSQGATTYWKDVGPYYYNTTDPWGGGDPLWKPVCEQKGKWAREPLAACQNPAFKRVNQMYTWRHGDPQGAGGRNNHVYADGAVKMRKNPQSWDAAE